MGELWTGLKAMVSDAPCLNSLLKLSLNLMEKEISLSARGSHNLPADAEKIVEDVKDIEAVKNAGAVKGVEVAASDFVLVHQASVERVEEGSGVARKCIGVVESVLSNTGAEVDSLENTVVESEMVLRGMSGFQFNVYLQMVGLC